MEHPDCFSCGKQMEHFYSGIAEWFYCRGCDHTKPIAITKGNNMNTQTVQDLLRKQEDQTRGEEQIKSLRRLAQNVRDTRIDLKLDGQEREDFIVFANRIEQMREARQAKIRPLAFEIGQTLYDAEQDERES